MINTWGNRKRNQGNNIIHDSLKIKSRINIANAMKDTKRWNDAPCSWVSKITTVKIPILPKVIERLSIISIKIPM